MTVGGIQREGHILIDAAALGTVLVGPSNHGALHSHYGHTALVAGGIAAAPVQTAGSIRFIKTAVRIVRLHGVALFGADAVNLNSQLIASGFAHIMGVQCVRYGSVFPLLPFIGRVGAGALHKRHKYRLVIVAAEGSGLVVLN